MDKRGQGSFRRAEPPSAGAGLPAPYLRSNILRASVVAVLDFLLARVWGPELINRHDDAALAAGVACFVVALVAAAWVIAAFLTDLQRLRRARRLAALRPMERTDIP